MRATADEKKRRRRKYPATAEHTGKRFVMTELLRRGFEAELAGTSYEKHDMLVWVGGSRPKPIRIKTVHSAPWYVRWDLFAKRADQVTVYVFLGPNLQRPLGFSWSRTATSRPNFVNRRPGKLLGSSTSNRWINTRITGIY
jgi:hypothetical protein